MKISSTWRPITAQLDNCIDTRGPNHSFICSLPSEISTVRYLKVIKVDELVLMDHHLC